VTLDFFRWGAKYYKVTERIQATGMEPAEIAALGFEAQLVLLKTVAHSLKILHDLGIVHGDLKPGNVLVKRTELGYTTKLIDFDNAYLAGDPPPPDELVGTMNYYSPELVGYIQELGTQPRELTQKADIFALGLIYAEYLTGALPPLDSRFGYASIAVRSGEVLRVPAGTVHPAVAELVDRMLLADPAARPGIGEVHATLMRVRPGAPAPAAELAAEAAGREAPSAAPATPTSLRGKGLRTASGRISAPPAAPAPAPPPAPAPAAPAVPAPTGRLTGKLLRRPKDPERT
jgi:serine/threonine protein kinase